MKNIRLFTLAVLMIGLSISSYADGKKGIRAGFQTSNLYYDGSGMNDISKSFYVGLFKENKIIPMLHIGSGFEYSQIGSYTDGDNNLTLHYLSVPIYAKFKIGPFYALGGAAANFKVGEKYILKGIEVDPIEEANWFDIPVFAGVGFQFLMLRVEARYHWGTMSLYDGATDAFKTQYFQIGLGVAI